MVVGVFVSDWGGVADGGVEADVVVPPDPVEGAEFEGVGVGPGAVVFDAL